jgi:putative membrane protein
MADALHLLWQTVLLRPYVFAYFLLYVASGLRELGLGRLTLFTIIAYGLAFASEASSIRTGFPYGLYRYHYQTVGQEVWIAGVPFFDSLSYTFLNYAGLCLALWTLGPCAGRERPLAVVLLTSLFVTCQDVVVDPVAVRGSRWFLGDLFDYPFGGIYFGVPLSNFAGWALVSAAICGAYLGLERLLPDRKPSARSPYLTGAALYATIMAANVALAFHIGEPSLGLAGLAVMAFVALVAMRLRGRSPAVV